MGNPEQSKHIESKTNRTIEQYNNYKIKLLTGSAFLRLSQEDKRKSITLAANNHPVQGATKEQIIQDLTLGALFDTQGKMTQFGFKNWAEVTKNKAQKLMNDLKAPLQKLQSTKEYEEALQASKRNTSRFGSSVGANLKQRELINQGVTLKHQISTLQSTIDYCVSIIARPSSIDGKIDGFVKGIVYGKQIPFISGLEELNRSVNLLSAVQKKQKGIKLTPGEDLIINSFAQLEQLNSQFDLGTSYNVGVGTAGAVNFIIELAMTGGATSLIKAGAQKGGQKLLQSSIIQSLKTATLKQTTKLAGKEMVKTVANKAASKFIIKIGTKAIEYSRDQLVTKIISAVGMAGIRPDMVATNTIGRMLDHFTPEFNEKGEIISLTKTKSGESFSLALMKGFTMTFTEFFTEQIGGDILSALGKAKGVGVTKFVELARKHGFGIKFLDALGKSEVFIQGFSKRLTSNKVTQVRSQLTSSSDKEFVEQTLMRDNLFGEYFEEFLSSRAQHYLDNESIFAIKTQEERETFLVCFMTGQAVKIGGIGVGAYQKISNIETQEKITAILSQKFLQAEYIEAKRLKNGNNSKLDLENILEKGEQCIINFGSSYILIEKTQNNKRNVVDTNIKQLKKGLYDHIELHETESNNMYFERNNNPVTISGKIKGIGKLTNNPKQTLNQINSKFEEICLLYQKKIELLGSNIKKYQDDFLKSYDLNQSNAILKMIDDIKEKDGFNEIRNEFNDAILSLGFPFGGESFEKRYKVNQLIINQLLPDNLPLFRGQNPEFLGKAKERHGQYMLFFSSIKESTKLFGKNEIGDNVIINTTLGQIKRLGTVNFGVNASILTVDLTKSKGLYDPSILTTKQDKQQSIKNGTLHKNQLNISPEIQEQNSRNSDKLINEDQSINQEAQQHLEAYLRSQNMLGVNQHLTPKQIRAIYDVHSMKRNIGETNDIQLNIRKGLALKSAGFNAKYIRVLMEGKVCGYLEENNAQTNKLSEQDQKKKLNKIYTNIRNQHQDFFVEADKNISGFTPNLGGIIVSFDIDKGVGQLTQQIENYFRHYFDNKINENPDLRSMIVSIKQIVQNNFPQVEEVNTTTEKLKDKIDLQEDQNKAAKVKEIAQETKKDINIKTVDEKSLYHFNIDGAQGNNFAIQKISSKEGTVYQMKFGDEYINIKPRSRLTIGYSKTNDIQLIGDSNNTTKRYLNIEPRDLENKGPKIQITSAEGSTPKLEELHQSSVNNKSKINESGISVKIKGKVLTARSSTDSKLNEKILYNTNLNIELDNSTNQEDIQWLNSKVTLNFKDTVNHNLQQEILVRRVLYYQKRNTNNNESKKAKDDLTGFRSIYHVEPFDIKEAVAHYNNQRINSEVPANGIVYPPKKEKSAINHSNSKQNLVDDTGIENSNDKGIIEKRTINSITEIKSNNFLQPELVGDTPEQQIDSLHQLASENISQLKGLVEKTAANTGGTNEGLKNILKGKERMVEKYYSEYADDGGVRKIFDVLRTTITYDTISELVHAHDYLKKICEDAGIKIIRRKNKLNQLTTGDLFINLQFPNGCIAELKLYTKEMFIAQDINRILPESTINVIEGGKVVEYKYGSLRTDQEIEFVHTAFGGKYELSNNVQKPIKNHDFYEIRRNTSDESKEYPGQETLASKLGVDIIRIKNKLNAIQETNSLYSRRLYEEKHGFYE